MCITIFVIIHTLCKTFYTGHVLHRYVKDACSIPVAGDGSEQAIIGCNSTFTISGGDSLLLRDSGKEPKCIAHLHE